MPRHLLLSALCLMLCGCPSPVVTDPPPPPGLSTPSIQAMFEAADCSGDQKMTEPEARTMIGIRVGDNDTIRMMTAQEFKQGDANQDLYMTLEEFTTLVRALDIRSYAPAGSLCPAGTTMPN